MGCAGSKEEEGGDPVAGKGKGKLPASANTRGSIVTGPGLDPTVTGEFACTYLGSVPVEKPTGNEMASKAAWRINNIKKKEKKVKMVVDEFGVVITDSSSHDEITSIPIGHISFTALDGHDKKLVSFISNDTRLRIILCHMFHMTKPDALPLAFKEAFAIMAANKKKNRPLGKEASEFVGGSSESTADAGGGGGQVLGCFDAQPVGSMSMDHVPKGQETPDSIELAFKKCKKLNTDDRVVIQVTSEGLKTIDGLSHDEFLNVIIKDITYTGTVANSKVFAFVCQDPQTEERNVQFFDCGLEAGEICTCIATAFQAAQKEKEEQGDNPFLAAPGEKRVAVKGILFTKQVRRGTLTPIKVIGAGQFGQVYRAKQKKSNGQEVLRGVKILRSGASVDDKREFVSEAESMFQLKHPNIVRIIGVALQQRPWLIVLEYVDYGDVGNAMKMMKRRGYPVEVAECLYIMLQVAAGMEYLASKEFIHLDLAARNVLLGTKTQAKIADFGLGRKLKPGEYVEVIRGLKLPIKWLAPECLTYGRFSVGSDCWAYAVTAWEVFSEGSTPYPGTKNQEMAKFLKAGKRLDRPESCPDDVWSIFSSCFTETRRARPLLKDIKKQLIDLFDNKYTGECRDIGLLWKFKETKIIVRKSIEALEQDMNAEIATEDPTTEGAA